MRIRTKIFSDFLDAKKFSKEIFVLKFYFATIFPVRSTERGRSRIRIHTCDQRMRMRNREAQKHTDPNPKHWFT
jgi:hypothetical protein